MFGGATTSIFDLSTTIKRPLGLPHIICGPAAMLPPRR